MGPRPYRSRRQARVRLGGIAGRRLVEDARDRFLGGLLSFLVPKGHRELRLCWPGGADGSGIGRDGLAEVDEDRGDGAGIGED